MGHLLHWLHGHHLAPALNLWDARELLERIKGSWVDALLVILGIVAATTAILIAWPALVHLAGRLLF